jgi:hypothetical protein
MSEALRVTSNDGGGGGGAKSYDGEKAWSSINQNTLCLQPFKFFGVVQMYIFVHTKGQAEGRSAIGSSTF